MTTHEPFRELLALRLYDELDQFEGARLDAHLEDCAACREFAAALGEGLGVVVPVTAGPDLPEGWRERLEEVTHPAAPSLVRPLLTFAAGLAAGLFVMTFNPDPPEPFPPNDEAAVQSFSTKANEGPLLALHDGPPPLAGGPGAYAMLSDLMRTQ